MFEIKNSNFVASFMRNSNVEKINYLSSNSIKVLYKDGTFQTYVLDDQERITYSNLNGEIIQINEYDEHGHLIQKTECTEYGCEKTTYDTNDIITPISKMQNGLAFHFA